jgi:uncharacterized membrane protein
MLSSLIPMSIAGVLFGSVPILDKMAMRHYELKHLIIMRFFFIAVMNLILIGLFITFYNNTNVKALVNNKGLKIVILTAVISLAAIIAYFYGIRNSKNTALIIISATGITLMTSILLANLLLKQATPFGVKMGFLFIITGIAISFYYNNN